MAGPSLPPPLPSLQQPHQQSPPLPLSQWLMQGLDNNSSAGSPGPALPPTLPYSSADLSELRPTSAGLPFATLGPSPFDVSPPEWLNTRQYCILAARATSGDLDNLSKDWTKYILESNDHPLTEHYQKALEALLCVHIFAGIPRCIEGLHTVYNTTQQYLKPLQGYLQLQQKGQQLTNKQQQKLQRLQRLQQELVMPSGDISEWGRTQTEAWQKVGTGKTCTCKNASYQCSVPDGADPHSSAIRNARGDHVLTAIYRQTYPVLAKNLHSYHPSLYAHIRQSIYGFQLARQILTIQEIECVAVACLAGMNVPRQLHSHIRGSKYNDVSYELLMTMFHDLRLVYPPAVVEQALDLLDKVYKHDRHQRQEIDDVDDDDAADAALQKQIAQFLQSEKQADQVVDKQYTIEKPSPPYGLGMPPLKSATQPPNDTKAEPEQDENDPVADAAARRAMQNIMSLTQQLNDRNAQLEEIERDAPQSATANTNQQIPPALTPPPTLQPTPASIVSRL